MGKAIEIYQSVVLDEKGNPQGAPWAMKLAGVGLAGLLIIGAGGLCWAGLHLLGLGSTWAQKAAEAIVLASCFAGQSLRRAAIAVLTPLQAGDLPTARTTLAMFVGRDTDSLSAAEIRRAVLETVSENAIDGVLAPLFYAIVGGLAGLAAPVAIAYKAASTLDSMVGYRTAAYKDLGWCSARLEDALTWLPCRLSTLTIALLSGQPGHVLRLCQRDAPADPSPNAGWSECAYAAALGVRLGGENRYRSKVTQKPYLGDAIRPITDEAIARALYLTRWSFLIGLGAGECLLLGRWLLARGL